MTSESLGCHDISRHRLGASARRERDVRAAASACRSGLTRSLWRRTASSGCTARRWGATGRGLGALGVGGTFVQYAHPLASRSRPSWSRPTRANSGRGQSRVIASVPQRRRRAGDGGGGPVTETPGYAARPTDLLLRGLVSTVLTLTPYRRRSPRRNRGISTICVRSFGGWRANVSAVDT